MAQKYGIPKSTLHDHITGKAKKTGPGGPTVLPQAVEREMVLTCIALAEMGYGLTRDLVEVVIFEYVHQR